MNKGGKIIMPKRHIATFRGKHNASKAKTFIVLYDAMFTQGITIGFSVGQLYLLSGVPYGTLKSSLGRWHSWQYVSRRAREGDNGRPIFTYWLGARGKHFVENRIPPDKLKQYITEIKAFRAKQEESEEIKQ